MRKIDKSNWPDGPWNNEPDNLFWVDEATGLPCAIVRNDLGALCGYVGVPPQHPTHGTHYDNARLEDVSVHGGLTFGGDRVELPEEHPELESYYWHGFDCGHYKDVSPGMQAFVENITLGGQAHYRDIDYVKSEVAWLARQLFDMISPLEYLARAADDE